MTEEADNESNGPAITLGKYAVTTPKSPSEKKILALIWGPSGCGKSTLAATAPGKKLWLGFDPGAIDGLGAAPDGSIIGIDLSSDPPSALEQWRRANPNKIEDFIRTNGVNTVVVDSVTTIVDKALEHGVTKLSKATIEMPGMQGYGMRNTITMQVIVELMRSAMRCGCHYIIVGHEDAPQLTQEGAIHSISPLIGGKMVNGVPIRLGEVWHMEENRGTRRIQTRPVRFYKPMKTRMFETTGKSPEFNWTFNPETWEGDTIEDWYEAWKNNEWKKIPLPHVESKS